MNGGPERFLPDGSFVPVATAPRWEWVYGVSFIFRQVVHRVLGYDSWLMKVDSTDVVERDAQESILLAVDSFEDLSDQHGFDLLFVIHPENGEIATGDWEPCFAPLAAALKNDTTLALVDLLDYFQVNEIITPENVEDWYWPIDTHHNSKGYEAMGKAIAKAVLERGLR